MRRFFVIAAALGMFAMFQFGAYAADSDVMDVKAGALEAPPGVRVVRNNIVLNKNTREKTFSIPDVQAVVLGGGRAFAIIGGGVYHVGDRIGGLLIIAIRDGRVEFARYGHRRVIKVGG